MKKLFLTLALLITTVFYSQVGINTILPTETLDVNGTARVRGLLDKAADVTFDRILTSDANGVINYNSKSIFGGVEPWNKAGGIVGSISNTDNIYQKGNVHIINSNMGAITSPVYPLSPKDLLISNSLSPTIRLHANNNGNFTNGGLIEFREFDELYGFNILSTTGSSGSIFEGLKIQSVNAGVTKTVIQVSQNNKVGINVENPIEDLEVNGNVRIRTLPIGTTITTHPNIVVAQANGTLGYTPRGYDSFVSITQNVSAPAFDTGKTVADFYPIVIGSGTSVNSILTISWTDTGTNWFVDFSSGGNSGTGTVQVIWMRK